jgi:hypothetical protein
MFKVMSDRSLADQLRATENIAIQSFLRAEVVKKRDKIRQAAKEKLCCPVYVVSDKWENPIVGWCLSFEMSEEKPVPEFEIFNYVTRTIVKTKFTPRIWCNMGDTGKHNDSGVLPLMDMTPYERWNFLAGSESLVGQYKKQPDNALYVMWRIDMYQRLLAAGFFNDIMDLASIDFPNTADQDTMRSISFSKIQSYIDKLIPHKG